MHVSPRPIDSLKSLSTQKFLFEFSRSFFLFPEFRVRFRHRYFRFCILLQQEASVDTIAGMEKKPFYQPTYHVFEGWVDRGETYIFLNVA